MLQDLIALARGRFQTFAIKNGDLAALILDVSRLPQHARCKRHFRTRRAEDMRQKFMGHRKTVSLRSIMGNQEPTAKPLFQPVDAITSGGLRYLGEHVAGVTQHAVVENAAALKLPVQCVAPDTPTVSRNLNQYQVRRSSGTQDFQNTH